MAINVDGRQEIDIKKYAKVEKIPGGDVMESRVLRGVMFQKDVVAPGRMRRQVWGSGSSTSAVGHARPVSGRCGAVNSPYIL